MHNLVLLINANNYVFHIQQNLVEERKIIRLRPAYGSLHTQELQLTSMDSFVVGS